MTPFALALLLLSAAPDAGKPNLDRCTFTANKGDRILKGADVVVKAGETIEDAIAIDGNVVVKSGGSVKSAIALHGSVIVEDGATVRESVVAIAGKTLVSKTAKVAESQVELDDKALWIMPTDGDKVEISASVAGENLSKLFLKPILEKVHDCDITAAK